jgi:phenylpropionate dioxygenase-like ring-hydroxylating dioxygenase large terminal subunit
MPVASIQALIVLSHTFSQALESYYEAKDDPACPFHGWKKSAQGKLVMEPWC